MTKLILNCILALSALSGSASCPCLAGPSDSATDAATKQQFQLSAQESEHPQLGRDEVNPNALVKMAQPKAVGPSISFGAPAQYATPAARAAAPPPALDEPGAFLKEKNVDWSHWVSRFADRWYYVLRQLEDGADVQFVTQRPAQFQFTCYSNGQIANLTIKQSSGNVIYDHIQVLALMQTVPLPAFPPGTMRTSITLVEGWESHVKRPGEQNYTPGSFGQSFPMEKVMQWMTAR